MKRPVPNGTGRFCYSDCMVSVTGIQRVAGQLFLLTDDGKRYPATDTGRGFWKLPNIDVGNNSGNGGSGSTGGGSGGSNSGLPAAPETLKGNTYTFNKTQLNHHRDIIAACQKISGANNRKVMVIVLITVFVESYGGYMFANTRVYPETANYPHDRDASDSDSVGLFQQRPQAGWGTPKECMTVDYSVKAFLGGPSGPNGGSPRGLFDIPNWSSMSPGKAAQSVQVSAFPTRYDAVVSDANTVLDYFLK